MDTVQVEGIIADNGREFHISERDLVLLHLGCHIILTTAMGDQASATKALVNLQQLGGYMALHDSATRVYKAATGLDPEEVLAQSASSQVFDVGRQMLEAAGGGHAPVQSQPTDDYDMPGYL